MDLTLTYIKKAFVKYNNRVSSKKKDWFSRIILINLKILFFLSLQIAISLIVL